MELKGGALSRSARVAVAINVFVICALGIVAAILILAAVAAISYRVDLRADLSRSGVFAPSPAAEKLLRALDVDVSVRFVYGRDEDIMRRTLDFARAPREDVYNTHYRPLVYEIARRTTGVLREWEHLSPRFRVSIVDADVNPATVQQWAAESQRKPGELLNRVWIRVGADERSVQLTRFVGVDWGFFPPDPRATPSPPKIDGKWRVQAELVELLRGVTAGESTRVYLPKGKRARVEAEDRESEGLRALLATQGFETVGWTAADGPPLDGVVLLAALGARLDADEIVALKRAEKEGGRFLLCGDPRQEEDFSALLEPFGLRLDGAVVEDPVHGVVGDPRTLQSSGLFDGGHEIVAGFARRATLLLRASRPIIDEKHKEPGAVREPILRASPEAFAIPVSYDPTTGVGEAVAGARRAAAGAFLGLACERPVDGDRKSRIVVFGGAGLVDADAVAKGVNLANRDLLLNTLNWLADRKAAVGAYEPDDHGARVPVTRDLLDFTGVAGIFVFPGALFAIALAVRFRRRA